MTKLKAVLGTNGEIMLACTSLRGVLFGDAACVCGWVSARIFCWTLYPLQQPDVPQDEARTELFGGYAVFFWRK